MANKGRKSQINEWLTEDGLILLEGWAREGLTDEEIAKKIGITRSTFYEWKKKNSDFSDALKKGKAPVDFKVENQLLKSALGHIVKIKEPIKVKTKKQLKDKGMIEEEHIEYVEKEIYIPPNVTAQFFWLKNRKPYKWRDKQNIAVSTEHNGQLADLIEGLKNNVYAEATEIDEPMADE